MNRRVGGRGGYSTGNTLVVMAILALGVALIYPVLRGRQFDAVSAGAIQRVEALRTAAQRFYEENAALPPASPDGALPQELLTLLSPELLTTPPEYTIAWGVWERTVAPPPLETGEPEILPEEEVITATDTVAAPPPSMESFGSVSVHSASGPLLARLLARYGPRASFVRDSTWTLLLPPASARTPPSGGGE